MQRKIKLVYYRILIYFYQFCGYFADQVAANSSWTRGHMDDLWNKGADILTLYPPCDTSEFIRKIKMDDYERDNLMISFAQFRPEK